MYDLKYVSDNGKVIHFGLASGFVVSSISDMTAITVDVSMSQGIGQVGGTLQGEAVQPKDMIINGEIVGLVGDRRGHLLNTILPGVGGRFVYNDTWEIAVRPLVLPSIQNNARNAKYQFTVRAPFPYWRNTTPSRLDLAGLIPRFSFPVNYGTPHMFGERIKTFFGNAKNEGNVPANFIATFHANTTLLNPIIVNVNTREFIKINREFQPGESVVVDMTVSPMTIKSTLQGISKNVFGSLDLDSTPFKLAVGDNILRYDAEENPDGLDCRISFRNTVTGPHGGRNGTARI